MKNVHEAVISYDNSTFPRALLEGLTPQSVPEEAPFSRLVVVGILGWLLYP